MTWALDQRDIWHKCEGGKPICSIPDFKQVKAQDNAPEIKFICGDCRYRIELQQGCVIDDYARIEREAIQELNKD